MQRQASGERGKFIADRRPDVSRRDNPCLRLTGTGGESWCDGWRENPEGARGHWERVPVATLALRPCVVSCGRSRLITPDTRACEKIYALLHASWQKWSATQLRQSVLQQAFCRKLAAARKT